MTFGAPLFGDEELSNYLDSEKKILNNLPSRMRNYVCSEDPIPKLLSYTQSLSSFSSSLDRQIALLTNGIGLAQEGTSYHRYVKLFHITSIIILILNISIFVNVTSIQFKNFSEGKNRLISQKDYCMDTLSKLVPLADATLEITSLIVPQANWARTGKNIVSLLSDLSRSSSNLRSSRSYER